MTEVIEQFHSQLEHIARAKIPLILDPASNLPLSDQLAKIRSRLATGSVDGTHAGVDSAELPENYKIALGFWQRGQYERSLDQLSAQAESQRFNLGTFKFIALQAFLIFACVFAGLVVSCVWLFPRLEDFSELSPADFGPGLRQLATLRNTLPVWGIAIPILVIVFWFFSRHGIRKTRFSRSAPSTDSVWLAEIRGIGAQPVAFRLWTGVAMVVCGLCVLLFGLSLFWPAFELLLRVSEPMK